MNLSEKSKSNLKNAPKPKDTTSTLAEMGVTKDQSSNWQKNFHKKYGGFWFFKN